MAKKGKPILNAWSSLIIIILALFVIWLLTLWPSGGNPISIECLAQSGFICQNTLLHGTSFTATTGQATGTNWINVNFIFVPAGVAAPPIGYSCPASGTNTTTSGLTCGTPSSINLVSGSTVKENFTFSRPAAPGSAVSGQIYAVYQTNVGGQWYETQITSGVNLKAT